MSDRADFCAFYYAQTGQAAVWIRDEKRFMFSNTELAWQSWQAAQGQSSKPCPYIVNGGEGTSWCRLAAKPPVNQQLMEALMLLYEAAGSIKADEHMLKNYPTLLGAVRVADIAIAAAQENNK